MSGDIVIRLRRISGGSSVVELARDAAAMIERLEAEVAQARADAAAERERYRRGRDELARQDLADVEYIGGLRAEVARLRAEVAVLRDELRLAGEEARRG